MKKLILIALTLLISVSVIGQERLVEKKETVSKSEEVYLNFKFANDIKVEQWDKNEVVIKVSVSLDNGKGNEFFNLKTERSAGELKIYSDFGDYFKKHNNRNRWSDDHNYTEINYIVFIPEGSSLRVKSISGSLQMDSFKGNLRTDLISGDITLKKYDGKMRLKTVSGDVDVTLSKAQVDAKTVTGTIYSDLNIDQEYKNSKHSGQNRVRGSINNGEELIVLTTVSGNIYMRKG